MIVLTRFGLGVIPNGTSLITPGQVRVELDNQFNGEKTLMMDVMKEVFPYTSEVLVKVLNVCGVGLVSGLQFCQEGEAVSLLKEKCPAGETRFFLNLATGEMFLSQSLGILVEEYLAIFPWVDRWARELSIWNEEEGSIPERFEARRRSVTVTAAGISAGCLLNIQKGRVEAFYVICEAGPVYERLFPIS